MAFVRFFSSETDKGEISKGFFSILFFVAITSLIVIIITFILSDTISIFLFNSITYSHLIQLSSILIILESLNTIIILYFRSFRKMFVYSGLTLFRSIGRIILTILFLVILQYGLIGVIIAAIISSIFPLFFGLFIIIRQVGFSLPSFSVMPMYLRFSLPIAPNSLINWITSSSDRYIIGYFLGASSVGIYSASYNIGNLVYFFVMPLQLILYPQLSRLYDQDKIDEVKTYLSYSLKFFLLIAIPSVVGLTVIANDIVILLTNNEFIKGSLIIPYISLSALLAGCFQIIINITVLCKKTKYNFWIQFFSASSNIALNFILIPLFGILGAAIATLISYVIMLIIAFNITSSYLIFKIDVLFILKIIVSSLIMGYIIFNLNNTISLVPIIFIGIIIYLISCYLIKIFDKNELIFLKNMFQKVKK